MSSTEVKVPPLKDYVGQERLVHVLKNEIEATIQLGKPLSNMLFSGPPGLGKSLLVLSLAEARGVNVVRFMGPAFREDLLALAIANNCNDAGHSRDGYIIDRKLIKPTIILLEEAEEISTASWEQLHDILEARPDGRRIFQAKVSKSGQRKAAWCPAVTVVITTNYLGRLRKRASAAVNRMGIRWVFEPYSEEQLVKIIQGHATAEGYRIDSPTSMIVASRSVGIPRTAKMLVDRCLTTHITEKPTSSKIITAATVNKTFENIGIDSLGLDQLSRDYLKALAQDPAGKLGLESIASTIGSDRETIQVDVEPFLMRLGLVKTLSGGRQITDKGLTQIGSANANKLHSHILDNTNL